MQFYIQLIYWGGMMNIEFDFTRSMNKNVWEALIYIIFTTFIIVHILFIIFTKYLPPCLPILFRTLLFYSVTFREFWTEAFIEPTDVDCSCSATMTSNICWIRSEGTQTKFICLCSSRGLINVNNDWLSKKFKQLLKKSLAG